VRKSPPLPNFGFISCDLYQFVVLCLAQGKKVLLFVQLVHR
jgi:hypothetical protein